MHQLHSILSLWLYLKHNETLNVNILFLFFRVSLDLNVSIYSLPLLLRR